MESNEINVTNEAITQDNDHNELDAADIADLFPVVELSEREISNATKIPIASLAALGSAFSQLPEAARTMVTTQKILGPTGEKLYVAVNEKGVEGWLATNKLGGTYGNIMQKNAQGKKVIAGRMNFREVSPNAEVTSVMPFDPTMMMVAVALVTIEKKLEGIQSSIDDVMKFLESDKQAKQRANLKKLAEIADEYKIKGDDPQFCANRNDIAQRIQLDAMQNIEFYQNKILSELRDRKVIPLGKDTKKYVETIRRDFAEYQLACYTYSYCSFMDIVLRRDFEESSVDSCRTKITNIASKYDALFDECRAQIASYQRSTLDNRVWGAIGKTANALGETIGNIPIIEKGPVDEFLVETGKEIKASNKKAVKLKVSVLEHLEDNRMGEFLEGIETVGELYNHQRRMVTDGTNIYVLDKVA